MPWGENDAVGATTAESTFRFHPGDAYTLLETVASADYYKPAGTWTLTVGTDYKITTTTTAGDHTNGITASGGKLIIGNDHKAKFNVVYNPNGGEFSDGKTTNKTVQYLDGDTCEVMSPAPTRDGYFFAGWKLNDTTTVYQPSDSFTVTESVTLTAQWTPAHDLTITKEVKGSMGDTTGTFTIYVQSDALTAATYKDNAATPNTYTVTDHKITLQMKHGDSITLVDLPEGAYTVTEEATGDAYVVMYRVNSGESSSSCSVTLNADTTVTVINTRETIAPTGYTAQEAPFYPLLCCGLVLLLSAALIPAHTRRRGRHEA